MIKRPLNPRFRDAVLQGIKVTTIRQRPWPFNVPIMLYNWEGQPYRSKQIDVCPVIVDLTSPIEIAHGSEGRMSYILPAIEKTPLWMTEGFDSQEDMNKWFRAIVPKGTSKFQTLMKFKRA